MLDSLLLLNSLNDSIRIIYEARLKLGPTNAIWVKLYNAQNHLDKQVAELLAPPLEESEAA